MMSTGAGLISAAGIGSGIDVNSLVSQLVAADRAPSDNQFAKQTNTDNVKLSSLSLLKSTLSGFQSSFAAINSVTSFSHNATSSSNSAAVTATATDAAVPNSYTVGVSQLAAANSMASPVFTDTTSAIGTGTLTFRFGTTSYNATTDVYSGFTLNPDSKVTTLTIDSSNNSLQGIAQTINNGNFGVHASIVNSGSGYQLLMSADNTGANNSLEVTVSDGDGNNTDTGTGAGLSNFAFNAAATNMTQTSAAQNALFTINGLAVQSAGNVAKNAITGVDLTLSAVTSAPVTVGISTDNSQALASVQAFINGYNSLKQTINNLTGYDPVQKVGGPLLGDFTVRSIMSQADTILNSAVAGITGNVNSLAAIGISTDSNGLYTLNTTKFNAALTASAGQMQALFSPAGPATDPNIVYKTSNDSTTTGNYDIAVTALATSGSNTGASVLPDFSPGSPVTLDSTNNSFTLTVDGVSTGSLALTPGVYQSGAALATEMQARINGAAPLVNANVSVKVNYDSTNNCFAIVSNSLGTTSTVDVTATGVNTAAVLGLSVQTGTPGQNVAGSIGGVAATGFSNVLTAASTSAAQGLAVTVGGTTTGARGSVNFTRGITDQLNIMLNNVLGTNGGLQSRIDAYNADLASITTAKAQKELQWTAETNRYTAQFTALDSLIATLNSTASFLTTQLANLPGVVSSTTSKG